MAVAIDADRIRRAFLSDGYPKGRLPAATGVRMTLIRRFMELYDEKGLRPLTRGGAVIRDCCPNGTSCWKPGQIGSEGGVSLPWIGPHYRPGGALILGMNFNEAWGLTVAFKLALWEQEAFDRGERDMSYGERPGYHSNFAYRSTRSTALLVDWLEGKPVLEREAPEELPWALDRAVRLQAVKCSPTASGPHGNANGAPNNQMWANCVDLLLAEELDIAKPGAIVAFGRDLFWHLRPLLDSVPQARGPRLHAATITRPQFRSDVFFLDHPNARATKYWPTSLESLHRYLDGHPRAS
jgi:hypothetical protein